MSGIGRGLARLEDFLQLGRESLQDALGVGIRPRAFFAPGRINLIGEHVDHSGGPSLALAVDRGTLVLGRLREDRRLRLRGHRSGETVEFELDALPASPRGSWEDYCLGVLRALEPGRLPGLDLWVGGNLPAGVGLSSSASLTVATSLAASRLGGLALDPEQLVEVALEAERGFVGVPCGRLDPVTVVHGRPGHALLVEPGPRPPRPVPLDLGEAALVVVESGVERSLTDGAYARRVEECEAAFDALRLHAPEAASLAEVSPEVLEVSGHGLDPTLLRRARHVVEESRRTAVARRCLESGDLLGLGELLDASHTSLREGMEVSTPELDRLVEVARQVPGVLGARLLGAGFGGSVLVLAEVGAVASLEERVEELGHGCPGRSGVHVLEPGGGPRELAG